MTDGVDANSAGAGGGADPRELELIARLWRERHAREDFERFETVATRKLRVLRASKTYPYMLLRVRLPDGLHMQARFNLDESMEVRVMSYSMAWRYSLDSIIYATVLLCVAGAGHLVSLHKFTKHVSVILG